MTFFQIMGDDERVVSRCANKDEACVLYFYKTLDRTWDEYLVSACQLLSTMSLDTTFSGFKRVHDSFGFWDRKEPFWALQNACCICQSGGFYPYCFFKPNFDFLTYTFKHFGAIRYDNWDRPDVQPSQYEVNMVNVMIRFNYDPSLVLNLSAFTALTVLIMNDCKVTDKGIKLFVTLSFPHLQNLNLSNNQIGSSGACDLVDMLLSNTTLKLLSLSSNIIAYTGVLALAKLIKSNTALNVLTLCGNPINAIAYGIDCNQQPPIETILANAIQENYTLDVFHAAPFVIDLKFGYRAHRRQCMASFIACAIRNGVHLSEDIWLRSFRFLLQIIS